MHFPHQVKPHYFWSVKVAALAGLGLLFGALLLYLATLDNGFQPGELEGGDLITHQYAQVQARPGNAPGYPLYTMGGWLWFHGLHNLTSALGNPLPNPIPLLSSYSTLWALVALWLFYRILCHLTRMPERPAGNWPLAWLLCAFYAVTYFFWYYATTTEQYSSAVAQTLAIVYVYLLWCEKIGDWKLEIDLQSPVPNLRYLILLAFLCGLSLAHMLTVALIVPPIVGLVLWQTPALLRSARIVLGTLVAAFIPLISYAYVYLRGAAHPEWWGAGGDWDTPQAWFWAFISTAQGRQELGWGLEPQRALLGNGFPNLMWHELSLPLFIIGLIGISRLKRSLAVLLYATLLLYAIFCWAYRYGNWFQVILPAYPLILLGVAALLDKWQQAASRAGLAKFRYLPLLFLALLIVWRINASWPAADSRNRPTDTAFDRPAVLLAQPLAPNMALFAAVDDALGLQYLTDIWQIRPDLRVVSSSEAAQWLAQGQPVYSTWQAAVTLRAELPPALVTAQQSAGPDWILFQSGTPTVIEKPEYVLEQAITPQITLYGYHTAPAPDGQPVDVAIEPAVDITLFWRIWDKEWPQNLSISVRPTQQGAFLADGSGGIIQQDRARPAQGLLALDGWPKGEPVADAYRLPLPTDADGFTLILYRRTAEGFENIAEVVLPLQ